MSDRSKNILAIAALVGLAAIASSHSLMLPLEPSAGVQPTALDAPAPPLTLISLRN